MESADSQLAALLSRVRQAFAEVDGATKEVAEINQRFGEPARTLDVIDDQIPEIKLRILEKLLQADPAGGLDSVEAQVVGELTRLTRLCANLPLVALLELGHEKLFELHERTANPYRQREEILDEIDSTRKALEQIARSALSGGELSELKLSGMSLLARIEDVGAKVKRSRRLRGLKELVWLGVR